MDNNDGSSRGCFDWKHYKNDIYAWYKKHPVWKTRVEQLVKAAIKRAFLKLFIAMTQLRVESAWPESDGEINVLSTHVVPTW